jgi:hypothetical protein
VRGLEPPEVIAGVGDPLEQLDLSFMAHNHYSNDDSKTPPGPRRSVP